VEGTATTNTPRLPPAAGVQTDPKRARARPEWRTASLVGLAGAIALALLSAPIRKEQIPRGDDLIYEDIARHPFGVHTFPFGFRLGLPLLVHVLPFDHTVSFTALALLAAGGAAAFAYLLMRELGGEQRVALALALALAISPPFLIVVLRHGRNTDIATVFLMMAATYFAVRRERLWLASTLALGAVVREAVLFVAPLAYALWAVRPLDRRAARDALVAAAPAIVLYLAIRLGVNTVGEAQVPGYGGSLVGERFTVIKQGLQSAFQEARRMFTVYGPLWLVAPLALRDMRFARRGLVLVAFALLSMTFALDWGRMILLAAPVFYPASAYVLSRRPRWLWPVLAVLLVLAVGYAVYMGVSGVQSGIIDNPAPPYPVR
jgi:hypothetical protein